jgi:hypothetical protein
VHHGKTLPKSSPWWNIWFPQNGWGCKCKVFGESERSLKRKGLSVSKEPKIVYKEWTDKATGEVHQVPEGLDPGFDYSPGKTDQATKIKEQRASLPPMSERVGPRLVPSAYSAVPSVNYDGLERITQQLLSTPAAAQVQKFVGFLKQFDVKTLIVSQAQMRGGSSTRRIVDDVASYLGVNRVLAEVSFTSNGRPEGFTSQSFNHVTVKAGSKQRLSRVDVDAMLEGVANIARDGYNGTGAHDFSGIKRWFAASEATGDFTAHASRYLTWLHEMGHQVHYKTGLASRPTQQYLTKYSNTNEREWFAEHFVFWLLDYENMQSKWPSVASWFDDLMEQFK